MVSNLAYKLDKSKGSRAVLDLGGKLADWLTFQHEPRGTAMLSSTCPVVVSFRNPLLGKFTGLNYF